MASKKELRERVDYYEAYAKSWADKFQGTVDEYRAKLAEQEAELVKLRRQVAQARDAQEALHRALYPGLALGNSPRPTAPAEDGWRITLTGLTESQCDAVVRALYIRSWSNWDDVPDGVVVSTGGDGIIPDFYCKIGDAVYLDFGHSDNEIDWLQIDVQHPNYPREGAFVEVVGVNKPGE